MYAVVAVCPHTVTDLDYCTTSMVLPPDTKRSKMDSRVAPRVCRPCPTVGHAEAAMALLRRLEVSIPAAPHCDDSTPHVVFSLR